MTRRTAAGAAMILGTSASIQIAAAIAHDLFDTLTPTGVSALRFALGTAIILPAVRPAVRGRDRETWYAIAIYGVSLGILTVTFFESIARLPLGLAVTFAFVAPLGVALGLVIAVGGMYLPFALDRKSVVYGGSTASRWRSRSRASSPCRSGSATPAHSTLGHSRSGW